MSVSHCQSLARLVGKTIVRVDTRVVDNVEFGAETMVILTLDDGAKHVFALASDPVVALQESSLSVAQ